MAHGSTTRLAEARTPEGRRLTLSREDGFMVMRIEGTLLMSNAVCYSEQLGCHGMHLSMVLFNKYPKSSGHF